MKTAEQIRLELGESDYLHVLRATKEFLLDHGLGKSGDYSAWRAALVDVQSTLPKPLRPYLFDMVSLATNRGLNK